jgi:hypothetical protein
MTLKRVKRILEDLPMYNSSVLLVLFVHNARLTTGGRLTHLSTTNISKEQDVMTSYDDCFVEWLVISRDNTIKSV